MMKSILHLFLYSQFDRDYVNATMKYCANEKHNFIIYGKKWIERENDYLYRDNIRYCPYINIELQKPGIRQYFDRFDMIIIHGLFDYSLISYFCNNFELVKKLIICFWGGDIGYSSNDSVEAARKLIIENAKAVINILQSDYDRLIKLYNIRGENRVLRYIGKGFERFYNGFIYSNNVTNKETTVLVGNSGFEIMRHIEIFDRLMAYKDEHIRVLIPLSYGEADYIEKVSSCAIEHFGNKASVILDFIPMDKYADLLSTVDIGIFALEEQQALGNLHLLYFYGAKLYLVKEGQLYKYFKDDLGYQAFDVDQIGNMRYEDFIKNDKEKMSRIHIKENINKFRIEDVMKEWSMMYEGFC